MSTNAKKTLHRVLLVVILLVLLAGAAVAGRTLLGVGGALVGETHHDFGLMPFSGRQVVGEHTFVLTNRSRSPVLIRSIKASCGCTKAEQNRDLIEPGEDLELLTTLRLGGSGEKKTTVSIAYEHEGETKTRVLHVRGTGRKLSELTASKEEVRVRPGRGANVSLFREMVGTADPPPPMEVTISPGFEYTDRGWKESRPGKNDGTRPRLWYQMLTVKLADPPATERGVLRIEQPVNQELEVVLIPDVPVVTPAPESGDTETPEESPPAGR